MSNQLYDISKQLVMQDIETMYQIINSEGEKSIFFMGAFPYFAICTYSAIEFMEKNGFDCKSLSIIADYADVLKQTRNKTKLYRERTNKNIKGINEIRENQHNEFSSALRFPILEKINWYYDFGTYLIHDNYIGNTFLYKWFFDPAEKINSSKPLFEFGIALGECVGALKNTWNFNYIAEGMFDFGGIYYKDYNITKKPQALFVKTLDKGLCLFLFNILCQVNFVLYYLNNIINKDNSLCIRIKYLVYYFSSSSLRALKNYTDQNLSMQFPLEESIQDRLLTLLDEKFCNCMRHYEIDDMIAVGKNKNGDDAMQLLVHHYFCKSTDDFVSDLEANLKLISVEIEKNILVASCKGKKKKLD